MDLGSTLSYFMFSGTDVAEKPVMGSSDQIEFHLVAKNNLII